MQPVKILKFLRQLGVLVQRNLQLIWNDKLLLASLALQSPFMVLVIKLTADPNCFYLQPCQHRQPHGAFYSGGDGDLYGHAQLLP